MSETLHGPQPASTKSDANPHQGAWIIWYWDGGIKPIALYGAHQELDARRRLDEATEYQIAWWPFTTDWDSV